MAFRKEKSRILSGSLNLAAPADQIPEPDCSENLNFRVDQVGNIRSRRGMHLDGTTPGPVRSLHRAGLDRYGTVEDVAGSNEATLRWGADLGTVIGSGFDASRTWYASMFDLTYAMNAARRLKTSGGGTPATNWGIEQPDTAPEPVIGAQDYVEFDEFDDGLGWKLYLLVDNALDQRDANRSFDNSNKISGNESLHCELNPDGHWIAANEYEEPKDSAVDEIVRDTDRFQFYLYASNSEAVVSVTVNLFDGQNSVYCVLDGSVLDRAQFRWNLLEVSRRLDPAALVAADPSYQGLLLDMKAAQEEANDSRWLALNLARQNLFEEILAKAQYFRPAGTSDTEPSVFDWRAITECRIDMVVSEPCDIHLDRARWVGGAVGTMSGEMTFYYTFANDEGHESNGSPPSEAIVVRQQGVTVNGILASADPQVTRRNVYVVGGAVDTPLRCGTIFDNTGTSLVIAVDFDTVQANNVEMPTDHGLPPAAAGVVGPHLGRLVAWRGNVAYWSKSAQPWAWPEENFREVGESGDDIVSVAKHGRTLYFFKQRSIWRQTGDIDKTLPEETSASVGCVGEYAQIPVGAVDYFVGNEGLYRFNGDTEEVVSTRVAKMFTGETARVGDISIQPMNRAAADRCVVEHHGGRIYLSYPEGASVANTATLVYEIDSQRWARDSRQFTAMHQEGTGNGLVGASGNAVYLLEQGADDHGAAIPLRWQSRFHDQGIENSPKTYTDLVVVHQTAEAGETPGALTVKAIYDNGTVEAVGSIAAGSRTASVFPLGPEDEGRVGFNFAVRIEGDAAATVTIYGIYLHWYAEAREGKTFDSGVVDLGPYAHEVVEMQADFSADASVAWKLYSDIPAGLVALRQTGALGLAARGSVTVPLSSMGRRIRFLATTAGALRFHSLRFKVRMMGVYVTSAAAWSCVPDPNDFALKVVKDLTLVYFLGPASIVLSTDMPSWGDRNTWAITASAPRKLRVLPVNGEWEGRLLAARASCSGSNELILQSLVARVRRIGTYIDGANGETWDTLLDELAAFQMLHLFSEVEVMARADGPMTLTVYTDLPGGGEGERAAFSFDSSGSGGTERFRFRFSGDTRGYLRRCVVDGNSACRLYGVRILARPLPSGEFRWYGLPVVPTPELHTEYRFPLTASEVDTKWVQIPVDEIA